MENNKISIALTKCYYCNENSDIILNTVLSTKFAKNIKEMDGKVINTKPCQRCAEYMKQGILIISIQDGEEKEIEAANNSKRVPNPYRTGGWVVVREEFIERLFSKNGLFCDEKSKVLILQKRFLFLQDKIWNIIGLPEIHKGEQ